MARILRTFGVVAGVVLLVVLAGRFTGVWSEARAPASTEPAVEVPVAVPQPAKATVRPKPRRRTDPARSAKQRWVRAANAICRRAHRESSTLATRLPEQRDLVGLLRLAEAERRLEARSLAELRRLAPPPGAAAGIARLVAAGRRRDAIERRVIGALRKYDFRAALDLAPKLQLAERRFGAVAALLGADDCGGPDLEALAATALDDAAVARP